MRQEVGPLRVEVIDPLQRIRVICVGGSHGVEFDLVWLGSFPVIDEPSHVIRQAGKVILDAVRLAQVGTWSGVLRGTGQRDRGDPDKVARNPRSFVVYSPVGRARAPGAGGSRTRSGALDSGGPTSGFVSRTTPSWSSFKRTANVDPQRGCAGMAGCVGVGLPEQLGWPELEINYRSGTRTPLGATLHMSDRKRRPVRCSRGRGTRLRSPQLGPGLRRRSAVGTRAMARSRLGRACHA